MVKLLRILSAAAVASAACFAAPVVVKQALLRHSLSLPDGAASIGIIGGADGPTAIFVTAGPAGFSLSDSAPAAGVALAAAAAGLWLFARSLASRKQQG